MKKWQIYLIVYGFTICSLLAMLFGLVFVGKPSADTEVKQYEDGIIYKQDGVIVIEETTTLPLATTTICTETTQTTATTNTAGHYRYREDVPLSQELQCEIWERAFEFDIPVSIVLAVIETESNFDETADNGVCYGLMQINRVCWDELCERLGCDEVQSPYFNILAGMTMLNDYFDNYGDWSMALMCYNCGEYGANRFFEQGQYKSSYSETVLEKAQKYE